MEISTHFLFYIDKAPVDCIITLDDSETHHAVNVLRVQQSDPITITDGAGTIFSCICNGFKEKRLVATVKETTKVTRNSSVHLLVGLPERDAFESILTECTALGISQITPVIATHCQRPWWKQSWNKNSDRFRSKMIVSMKQALYPFLPLLNVPISLVESLNIAEGIVLVADHSGEYLKTLNNSLNLADVSCYIGPPGGFFSQEIDMILKHGGHKVKIGESRLRTELASVALCAQLKAFQ